MCRRGQKQSWAGGIWIFWRMVAFSGVGVGVGVRDGVGVRGGSHSGRVFGAMGGHRQKAR